ncbi:hypothetical protein RJ639_043960 [Escallonia herrerae]|uniref:Uncharacterized protein n=1 Tax=Escallonia herrerae TaxID=1293975 RepID=A0AA88WAX0_9ASTE|nr:hypothetical protein RJ639_043960 [Escallonia herrerae]
MAYQDSILLVSRVKNTLITKSNYIMSLRFSRSDVVGMFLRFPGLLKFSVEKNFKPNFEYFQRRCKASGRIEGIRTGLYLSMNLTRACCLGALAQFSLLRDKSKVFAWACYPRALLEHMSARPSSQLLECFQMAREVAFEAVKTKRDALAEIPRAVCEDIKIPSFGSLSGEIVVMANADAEGLEAKQDVQPDDAPDLNPNSPLPHSKRISIFGKNFVEMATSTNMATIHLYWES